MARAHMRGRKMSKETTEGEGGGRQGGMERIGKGSESRKNNINKERTKKLFPSIFINSLRLQVSWSVERKRTNNKTKKSRWRKKEDERRKTMKKKR